MATKAVNGKVTEQQELFCSHYAVILNVRKAADAAGYRREYGYQLLKLPHIIDRIAEIQRNQGVSMVVTRAKVIRETAYIAYSDVTEVMGCRTLAQFQQLPENVRKAIRDIKITRKPVVVDVPDPNDQSLTHREVRHEEIIEIKMHSKTECLRLLSLISGALQPEEEAKRKDRPAFTGVDVISGGKRKRENEDDQRQLPQFIPEGGGKKR